MTLTDRDVEEIHEIITQVIDRRDEIVIEEIARMPQRADSNINFSDFHQALLDARKRWREEMTA